MPDQTAVFVRAMVAGFGDRAYPYALEQVSRAAGAAMHEVAVSWSKIADGIASLPAIAPPIASVLIDHDGSFPHVADPDDVRQLLYVSVATRLHDEDALAEILRSSRDNNVLYSVTGILWSDGKRFIQVLEGPLASVQETYHRILIDKRHHSLAVIYDRLVPKRGFGAWSMCHRRSYETDDEYDQKIRRALAASPSPARGTLQAFIVCETSRRTAAASWSYEGSLPR